MFVANTQDHMVNEDSILGTFMIAQAPSAVRRDYFLVTSDICVAPKSCMVNLTFNTQAKSDDRLPMSIEVVSPSLAREPISKRHMVGYLRQAVQQEATTWQTQPFG